MKRRLVLLLSLCLLGLAPGCRTVAAVGAVVGAALIESAIDSAFEDECDELHRPHRHHCRCER